MKKALIFLVFFIPCMAFAQTVQNEAVGFITYNKDRVMALANKFTEDQYNWRPAEGVRSVGEVILHIAGGNYFFITMSGGAAPEGLDLENIEKMQGKDKIIATLTESYTALTTHINLMTDANLADRVELPWPGDHSKLTIVFLGVDHTSEHLGQLIAYARMNGVTPPWNE